MSKLYQKFQAWAVQSSLGLDPIHGTVFFTVLALNFEGQDLTFEIPLQRLNVELAPDADERVFFTDCEQPGLTIGTSDLTILENRSVPRLAALADERDAQLSRRELARRLKLVLGFFIICGLILWLGMLATGLMVRSIVSKLSPEFEQQYGDSQGRKIQGMLHPTEDTNH